MDVYRRDNYWNNDHFGCPIQLKKPVKQTILYLLVIHLLWSCASVQAPQGGPKDNQGPKLLLSNPKNGAIQTSPKIILLDFNEEIVENNIKQHFISPYLSETVVIGNRRIKIKADSGFMKNTGTAGTGLFNSLA